MDVIVFEQQSYGGMDPPGYLVVYTLGGHSPNSQIWYLNGIPPIKQPRGINPGLTLINDMCLAFLKMSVLFRW